jgi:enoyl-CoA hydratase/carnithine racemase
LESDASVLYERQGQVSLLTLDRPHRLNAFSDDQVRALDGALQQFDHDEDAMVAILHGAGRAFSTGADVQQRQLRPREELIKQGGPQARGAVAGDLFSKAVNWKPVIAAVHGYVMGLSVGIMLDCDLIVAEAGTQIQITEVSRGLGGARYWGLMQFRGGAAFANEVALTGRFFSAEEAFAAGLINRVAPKGEYINVAMELAEQVGKNPPLSVRSAVRVRRWQTQRMANEIDMYTKQEKLYLTDDFQESARAFKEKRKPGPYKGR